MAKLLRERTDAEIPTGFVPFIFLSLFLAYLWPRYFYVDFAGKGVSAYTVSTMLLFVLSLYLFATRPQIKDAVIRSINRCALVCALFFAWWLWRLASDIAGVAPSASLGMTIIDFLYLGVWLISAIVVFTDQSIRTGYLVVIAISAIVAALFGLLESVTGTTVAEALRLVGLQTGDAHRLQTMSSVQLRDNVVRVRSLFSQPLIYGQISALMTPTALHLILNGRSLRLKALGSTAMVALTYSLYISVARSPFLMAGGGCTAYIALRLLDPTRVSRLSVLLGAAVIALVLTPTAVNYYNNVAHGRTHQEVISSDARVYQISRGASALRSRPIAGYGDGNAEIYAGIMVDKILVIDNYYLTVAINNGYVGLSLLVVMLTGIICLGGAMVLRRQDEGIRCEAAVAASTVVAVMIGFTVATAVDELTTVFAMGGMLIAISGSTNPTRSRSGRRGVLHSEMRRKQRGRPLRLD